MTLADWRRREGLTLQDLAKVARVSAMSISRIEKSLQRPSTEVAKRIEARTHGEVTAASLLGLKTEKSTKASVREDAAAFDGAAALEISIPLPALLQEDIRALGIDAVAVAREGALRALKEAAASAWREANKDAIEQNRRYIEKHGTFAEQMGLI